MTESKYTWEDFKREHPADVVERFEAEWKLGARRESEISEWWNQSLYDFVSAAFVWNKTNDGIYFWGGVATGKHRKPDAGGAVWNGGAMTVGVGSSADSEQMNSAFYRLKKSWSDLTMAIGMWFIDGRDTNNEKMLNAEVVNLNKRIVRLQERLDSYVIEKDKELHEWRGVGGEFLARGEEILNLKSKLSGLTHKHILLRKRYNTLRDRTISNTPTRKRKASKK